MRKEGIFCGSDEAAAAFRRMLLAGTTEDRVAALMPIQDFQQAKLESVFKVMDGLPVTVGLGLPAEQVSAQADPEGVPDLADEAEMMVDDVKRDMDAMQEVTSTLNSNGRRQFIAYPEVLGVQVG